MSEVVREVIKRDIEISEYPTYYRHDFSCSNCGRYQGVYILRGRPVTGLGAECERCGCYTKFRPHLAMVAPE